MLLNLKRIKEGLAPCDDESVEAVKKLAIGEDIHVEYKPKRNYKNHKRFFSMLQAVQYNQQHYKSIDNILEVIKYRAGYFDTFLDHNGNKILKTKSIAFHAMTEDEFQAFFSVAIDVSIELVSEDALNSILRYC